MDAGVFGMTLTCLPVGFGCAVDGSGGLGNDCWRAANHGDVASARNGALDGALRVLVEHVDALALGAGIERRPRAEFANEPPARVTEILGRATRRALRAGQALRSADLMKPELVQRGEMVTLHYEVPGIAITMRGKALESGSEGDTVNVLNEHSKRTIQGTVTSAGHITMIARIPTVVAQAEPAAEASNR